MLREAHSRRPTRDDAVPTAQIRSPSMGTPPAATPDLAARRVRVLARAKRSLRGGREPWLAVAAVLIFGGAFATISRSRAVARSEAAKARLAFRISSEEIASTLKLAIQH